MTSAGGEITQMLQEWRAGESAGLDRLLARLYDELRQTAHRERLRLGGRSAPLETTVLVHETYLRLARADPGAAESREHFLAIASRAMRQLLIDELRRRGRQKRGNGQGEETLPELLASPSPGSRRSSSSTSIARSPNWESSVRGCCKSSSAAFSVASPTRRSPSPWGSPAAPPIAIGSKRAPGYSCNSKAGREPSRTAPDRSRGRRSRAPLKVTPPTRPRCCRSRSCPRAAR